MPPVSQMVKARADAAAAPAPAAPSADTPGAGAPADATPPKESSWLSGGGYYAVIAVVVVVVVLLMARGGDSPSNEAGQPSPELPSSRGTSTATETRAPSGAASTSSSHQTRAPSLDNLPPASESGNPLDARNTLPMGSTEAAQMQWHELLAQESAKPHPLLASKSAGAGGGSLDAHRRTVPYGPRAVSDMGLPGQAF